MEPVDCAPLEANRIRAVNFSGGNNLTVGDFMVQKSLTAALLVLATVFPLASRALAQQPPDPGALIAQQREAMERLPKMDGLWSGTAWVVLPSGERKDLLQTERVGSMLDGTIKVIEGRGTTSTDGRLAFNAFAILSFDPQNGRYSLRSYAQGRAADFAFTLHPDGYEWEMAAGPSRIVYTAQIGQGSWHEFGERLLPSGGRLRFFEMDLRRIGDTDWPAAGAPVASAPMR